MENSKTPPDFKCPISLEIMNDPVICEDGNSYERKHIEEWFKIKITSPLTGKTLSSASLTPNQTLKRAIIYYLHTISLRNGLEPSVSPEHIPDPSAHSQQLIRYIQNKKGKYMGEVIYKDNKYVPHGRGVYTFASGNKYEGEWKDDMKNGRGVYTFASGNKYDGEWKDNKKNGRGVYTFTNGNKYDGEWKDSKENGHGVYMYSNGDKYDGEFKYGNFHRRGVYNYANGDKYDGEFKNGNFNGRGVYTCANGDIYNGEWKDGNYVS